MKITPSDVLKVNFIDIDRDGDIDQLTRAETSESGDLSRDEISLADLGPGATMPYFSKEVYANGSAASLKGVAIKPLEEYLHQMQLKHLIPQQKFVLRQAEVYFEAGEPEKYVEYLAKNSVCQLDSVIIDPLLEAARQAHLAGLDLSLVHPDALQAAQKEAEQRLQVSVINVRKKDKMTFLNDAFAAADWAGQTTIFGQTKKQWEEIISLDETAAKNGVNAPGHLAKLVIQIASDEGYVYSRRQPHSASQAGEYTLFGPQINFSIQTSRILDDYLHNLKAHPPAVRLVNRLVGVIANFVSGWFHKQIEEAKANQQNPRRGNTPIFWESLNQSLNTLPEAIQGQVKSTYLAQFGVDPTAEINQGWIVDLELARDLDLSMAHGMNSFLWLEDAMGSEVNLRELGGTPEESIDWNGELRFFEGSTGTKAPEALLSQSEELAKYHSRHGF